MDDLYMILEGRYAGQTGKLVKPVQYTKEQKSMVLDVDGAIVLLGGAEVRRAEDGETT